MFADLQKAAAGHGHVNVQQATLPAQATDAAPELASLIQQRCAVIFALGPLSTTAVRAAGTNARPGSSTKLVAITDNALTGRNLTTIPLTGVATSQITSSVDQALN